MKVELREHEAEKQCPYCHESLGTEGMHACSGCATEYHAECAREAGRCAVLGCGSRFAGGSGHTCRLCRQPIPETETSWYCHLCGATYHRDHGIEGGQCRAAPCAGVLIFREARTPSTSPPLYLWDSFKLVLVFAAAAAIAENIFLADKEHRFLSLSLPAFVFASLSALFLLVLAAEIVRGIVRSFR